MRCRPGLDLLRCALGSRFVRGGIYDDAGAFAAVGLAIENQYRSLDSWTHIC